jgi:DNA-binding protein HU-beta
MTKPQIISLIAERAEISKKAAGAVLNSIVTTIHGQLKGDKGKVRIADLGTFRVIQMNARKGVNPRTGKNMTIPAMKLPRFTASKALREIVQGKK